MNDQILIRDNKRFQNVTKNIKIFKKVNQLFSKQLIFNK